ncbi:MAG: hypothetical protein EB107_00080, partial [Proteobacteria bacterium]|nr:hypothetical protein [Pseudomonadota bacterium]
MNLHVFENSAARAPSELVTASHDTAFAARVATGDGGASDATVSDKDAADRPSPVIARGDPFAGRDGENLLTGPGAVISGSEGRPACGNFIEPA